MKEEESLDNRQRAFATGIISAVYAFVIQLTEGLDLIPDSLGVQFNVAIFVPAIASILFGKFIGGAGAAGGQFLNTSGQNLITGASSGGAGAAIAGAMDFSNLIIIASDFIGAWIVGSLTEKPDVHWDNFISRFTSASTWSRLSNNTLGSIIGLGMVNSLISSYGLNSVFSEGTTAFVQTFFLNSILLVIFVPITLILYEIGDIFVQVRAQAKDKSMRRLTYNSPKEEAVTVISARLMDRALSENQWTPVQIKFRSNLETEQIYRIEAISTANFHPAFDNTEKLKKGDVWEQKFFILPSKQKNVDFKVRITPMISKIEDIESNIQETIIDISGKSYNPNKNTATLVLFSIINSIMVGASIVWNNLLEFMNNAEAAFAALQQSWVFLMATGSLELLLLIPFFWFMKKRWKSGSKESLTVGFGTDLSERSQKIFKKFDEELSEIFNILKDKFERSVKVFLIFVSTVAVIILGLEGFNGLTNPNYKIYEELHQEIFIISLLAIVLWIGGYKGMEILKSAGFIEEDKFEIQDGSVISKFKPNQDFFDGTANEVEFTIHNPTENNGIRIKFLGQDTVSPPLVELPVPAGENAVFKTSITPIATGNRNILAVVYPLFGKDGKFIDENTAEPFTHQSVNYQVQSQTQIGISKDQESKLKKLLTVALIFAAFIYGSGVLVQQLIGADAFNLIKDNAPFILALQGPFVYAYFYLQNKAKILTMEMEDILDQISTIEAISDDLNKKLDKTILKSSKFSKNLTNVMKGTLEGMAGKNGLGQINNIISEQIKDINIDEFLGKKSEILNATELKALTTKSTEFIGLNYKSKINDLVKDDIQKLQSDELSDEDKNNLKSEIKNKVKSKLKDEVKKEVSKDFIPDIVGDSVDELVKARIPKLQKSLKKELKKQLEEGQIVDDVLKKVNEQLSPDIKKQISDELSSKVFNRQMFQQIAEDLDSQLGSSNIADFENAVGTALESEMGDKLKSQLESKYNTEVMEKINEKLKKRIKREILKNSDKLIKDSLTKGFQESIKNNINKSVTDKLSGNLDSIIESSMDSIVDDLL